MSRILIFGIKSPLFAAKAGTIKNPCICIPRRWRSYGNISGCTVSARAHCSGATATIAGADGSRRNPSGRLSNERSIPYKSTEAHTASVTILSRSWLCPTRANCWPYRNTAATEVFRCSKCITMKWSGRKIYRGITAYSKIYGFEEAEIHILLGGELEHQPAKQTKYPSDPRYSLLLCRDQIRLPQMQHERRVFRVPPAIHV